MNPSSTILGRLLSLLAGSALATILSSCATTNGFDVENATIPVAEIRSGGPPRDGIPSLVLPKFVAPARVNYLRPDDLLLSFTHGGETRAYPLRILVWHEIVNDRVGNLAINVSYCPLCGSAMVFDRTLAGRELFFGVSGLLYQSDVLMYDRQTESLWSQLMMAAVSGPHAGQKLRLLPSETMTWRAWRQRYPDGQVLSNDTGYDRDYDHPPYEDYERSPWTLFPVSSNRKDLPTKAWVAGVVVNGVARAYPHDRLPDGVAVEDTVGGAKLRVHFDGASRRIVITDEHGESVAFTSAYWFAWQAFYPETTLWPRAP